MLEELFIKDFALIEELRVPWTKGLNVLTGETGAGKSILLDALNVVLGGKTAPNNIRLGKDRSIIEATFHPSPAVIAWLKQQELWEDETPELVISRDIGKSGSRCRINGTLVNVSLIQELRQKLLTVHTQHEARTLFSLQSQLETLDSLGSQPIKLLKQNLHTVYGQRRVLKQQLNDLQVSEEERIRRLEFIRFQLNELEQAFILDVLEDSVLQSQCHILANSAQLEALSTEAYETLKGQQSEVFPSALELVQKAILAIESAKAIDPKLTSLLELLYTAQDNIEESARTLRKYREGLDADPEKLSQLEARLAVLATIKRKYGPTLKDALSRQEELSKEIFRLENIQIEANQIEGELAKIDMELANLAARLSIQRQKIAQEFVLLMKKELNTLGMEHCQFEIAFEKVDIGPTGFDRIEFMISTNPGQPLLPLTKIASGGELSRIMLAIKSIVTSADHTPTVIFDEIDTGLSGRILNTLKDKLAKLARTHQILCITHQPIVASVADNHVLVNKEQGQSATWIKATVLGSEQKVKSLANMASGHENEESALRFAESLYNEGQRLRGMQQSLQ